MEGWFSVDRALLSHAIWTSEPFTRGQAWVDMIGLANHAAGFIRVRGIMKPILRGQLGWSQVKLAERWQWSRTKVRTFLEELEKEQQIIQQNDNESAVITILNYDHYQTHAEKKTAEKQQKDTNKNDKKEYTHLPGDESTAVAMAERVGVPSWFAIELFNQLGGRDWVDGAGQPVRDFMRHAKYRWNHRLSKINEERLRRDTGNQQPRRPSVDRNANTANADKASEYKRSV